MSEARLCYPLSARQLRKAHDMDWMCCSKYFGTPLRTCNSQEPDEINVGCEDCISDDDFDSLLKFIDDCWRKWSTALEVCVDTSQTWGWSIKVRSDFCLKKLYIPPRDRTEMGWTSRVATYGPSEHLYNRSPIQKEGYLGGVLSLANWGKTKIVVERHSGGPKSPTVYVKNVTLARGEEFLWNYGGAQELVKESSYNPQCCKQMAFAHHVHRAPRLPKLSLETPWRRHFCLLCGTDITSTTRGNPSNFKEHYVKEHAQFFSSSESVVDWEDVLYHLEIFRKTLAELQSKHYHVSFCNVPGLLSDTGSEEQIFDSFKRLFDKCKRIGVLLLKGDKVPICYDDLQPDMCKSWSQLQWTKESSPKHGRYVSHKATLEVTDIDEIVKSRVCNILQHVFSDS
ncbi:Acyl-CoA synthetase short-chain family member B, mitochondrial [Frankliniella fusca]|uniref:Acyl-CoA synthetase short-chain family member B, mitochondrial n=1 Tax=Frankliniella fusca TaxID=407009 RepID=A0AAE1HHU0_9NEOP|nr:Acyl-CoA synthetase short-chain family member B, mitochondrial [Frankliniella fusca]KAK3917866.1 Acyl-CoA synthetase short-chain family member B, mitochondrial [Frankliniella fusca]KAK3921425.1 Acyl-CoA synthetase short-chain family member B, mitochondrial [Frankliniella fusca]KAK3921632.1 Acyl-CoA synthetase short-chain family member B, mitochondrial [Frankliniella fusca]KAK3923350.1 Acyl-CoA synthetase short-chain family member B, mitochondrial [Frankliniella fusca]